LHDLLANLPVHVLQGEKVVEVRLFGIHKGIAAQRIVLERPVDAILAVGDDSTDDDMFEALPASSINVRVGPRASRARYQLADVNAVRDFLRRLTPRSG
jgi:trehalose 6-phosphate synthase/phosphatase